MLMRLFQSAFAGSRRGVDPSRFDDPMAYEVAWTPRRRGGTNFCTRTLVEVSPSRYEFHVSTVASFFYLIPLVIGLGFLASVVVKMYEDGSVLLGPDGDADLFRRTLIGIGCLAVGAVLWYFVLRPIVFDTQSGLFWKGRYDPETLGDGPTPKNVVPLERIYAIQILGEYCSGENGGYYSYELNLILDDRSRVNVVDHGDLGQIRADAATLSIVLGRPVWDGA